MLTSKALLAFLSAVVGGVVATIITLRFHGATTPPRKLAQAAEVVHEDDFAPDDDQPSGSNQRDLNALQDKVSAMERRITLLTTALARRGAGDTTANSAGEGAAADPAQADVADPVFEAAVLDIFEREETRKKEEQNLVIAQNRQERAERTSTQLSQKLGLRPEQEKQLSTELTKQYEVLANFRADAQRGNLTRDALRENIARVNTDFLALLPSILTGEQLRDYEALPPEEQINLTRRPGQRNGNGSGQNANGADPNTNNTGRNRAEAPAPQK